MRKMWLAFCVLTAGAAGWILYDSMVVGLYFQDRRQGVFLLAAGLGLCVFYAWSVHMAGTKRRKLEWEQDLVWRGNRREIWFTGIAAGAAAAGLGIYCLRYQSVFKILFCAILIFGWTFAAGCLLPLLKTTRELPEKDFGQAWRKYEEKESAACTLREEETVREMISKLVGIYNDHAVCQVIFCAVLFWRTVIYMQGKRQDQWMLWGLIVLVPIGFLLLEAAKNFRREQVLKQLWRWMEENQTQAVIQFFAAYYEKAAYRAETLPRRVRKLGEEAIRGM